MVLKIRTHLHETLWLADVRQVTEIKTFEIPVDGSGTASELFEYAYGLRPRPEIPIQTVSWDAPPGERLRIGKLLGVSYNDGRYEEWITPERCCFLMERGETIDRI